MSQYEPSLMNPPIEDLLDKVDSKFSLVTLVARRARQINAYYSHLGSQVGSITPPQFDAINHKALSAAFEEVATGFVRPTRDASEGSEVPVSIVGDDTDLEEMEFLAEEVFVETEFDGE
ncbi:MAG: DNA-directed RNA polymerase subunit omega [Actinomycetota bacterium]|nr:DNA-directed RNA polymerase subunit omega [Actinomycetota bacterium]